jgi:cytochrome c5
MPSMKRLLTFVSLFLLLLTSCASESKEEKEERTESKEEAAAELKLAAGRKVYESNCAGCHDSDVAGAPTPGDKNDWKERMAQSADIIVKKSIAGFEGKKGAMPPKGGNPSLTDEEVTNAVLYMINASK